MQITSIIWTDIAGGGEWMNDSEAKKWGKKQYNLDYTTVGYILYEDEYMVLIAGSFFEEDEEVHYNDVSMIPRAVIKDIKHI